MKAKYTKQERLNILNEPLTYEELCDKYQLKKGTIASWASRLGINRVGGRPRLIEPTLQDILDCCIGRGECIEWPYGSRNGYGRIWVDGKIKTVTRLVYSLFNKVSEESMKGLVVMHKCDNPPCVNPQHLVLGTHADNVRDMVLKGRNK